MVATRTLRPYTYQDLAELPDDGLRYEVLQGELIVSPAPTPRHQAVIARLIARIDELTGQSRGVVLPSPIDVELSENDIVQPDLVFVTTDRIGIVTKSHVVGAPDIVFEVLSPSTRRIDLIRKASLYARAGVGEYWIVDPETESIEVRAGNEQIASGRFADHDVVVSRAVPGLEIALDRVFANLP